MSIAWRTAATSASRVDDDSPIFQVPSPSAGTFSPVGNATVLSIDASSDVKSPRERDTARRRPSIGRSMVRSDRSRPSSNFRRCPHAERHRHRSARPPRRPPRHAPASVAARAARSQATSLLHVDRFALTANNITYAAFGDAMSYWDFFPSGEADWGRVPVWGFGTVVASRCDGVAVGERFYGYFPMSTQLRVTPAKRAVDRLRRRAAASRAAARALQPVHANDGRSAVRRRPRSVAVCCCARSSSRRS